MFVFFLVPFKASIGISEVENYLPVINRQQNNLTDYNAKNLSSRISFDVPVRSLTLGTTFKWTHNGAVLVAGDSSRVNSSNGALDIFSSTLEDEGVYQFFTSNELGTMFARKVWIKFAGDFIIHWFPLRCYFVAETPNHDDNDNECGLVFIFQSLGYFAPPPHPSTSL